MPTINPIPGVEDTQAHGANSGGTSAQRWLDNMSMNMVPVDGFHMGDQGVAPGVNYVRDPSLITIDAQGHRVTPRWNTAQAGVNDHFSRNAALLIGALAAGGVGLAAMGGEVGAGAAAAGTAGDVAVPGAVPLLPGADTTAIDAFLNGGAQATADAVTGAGTVGSAYAPAGASPFEGLGPGGGLDPETLAGAGGQGTTTPGQYIGLTGGTPDPLIPGEGQPSIDINGPETGGGGGMGPGGGSSGPLDFNPPSWWDTISGSISSGLDTLSGLKGLPGILSALGGAGTPPAGGGGLGAGAFAGAGQVPGRPRTQVQLETNPYGKPKPTPVGSLASYLRG